MKKIICVFLAMVMVLLLAACGGNNTPAVQGNGVAPTGNGSTIETMQPSVTEPSVTESNPTETPEKKFNPMEGLLAARSVVAQSDGAYLIRDGKMYSLNSWVDNNVAQLYYGFFSLQGGSVLYTTQAKTFMISYGDVPVPVLQDLDKIVMYSDKGDVPTLTLRQVEFIGYTISVYEDDVTYYVFDLALHSPAAMEQIKKRNINNFTVTDEEGSLLDDWRFGLEYGAEYTVSWFQGTQYNERKIVADSKCYRSVNEERIKLEGNLTREGYVEFDLSGIPAGLYALPLNWLGGSGLIEIT